MPHKRAKRSAREHLRQQRGFDLAPERQSLSNEAIPKSVARVIDAGKIRKEWKSKKRQPEQSEDRGDFKRQKIHHPRDDGGKIVTTATPSHRLKIQPGESIQHFNRRVEDDTQPIIRSAVQAARTTVRRNIREGAKDRQTPKISRQLANKISMTSSSMVGRPTSGRKTIVSENSRNGTTEHVTAPPKDFAKFSAGVPQRLNDVVQAPPTLTALPRRAKRRGVAPEPPAQRLAMDKERETAIRRYRLLKERRRKPCVAEGVEA